MPITPLSKAQIDDLLSEKTRKGFEIDATTRARLHSLAQRASGPRTMRYKELASTSIQRFDQLAAQLERNGRVDSFRLTGSSGDCNDLLFFLLVIFGEGIPYDLLQVIVALACSPTNLIP